MRGRVRQAYALRQWHNIIWSRGVTVSTLDSESSDRCSNPRGTSSQQAEGVWLLLLAAQQLCMHMAPLRRTAECWGRHPT